MNIKPIALAAGLCVAMASACAGDFYVLGSIGQSKVQNSNKADVDNALVAAGVTGLSSTLDDSDTGYKLQLGYKFTPNFALEGGYVDLGKFNYHATFTGPTAGSANADIKASGWNLAAVGAIPLGDQFSLFAKVGAIDAKVEESVSAGGSGSGASVNASATKWKTNYGLGVTFNPSKSWGIRAEWERFQKLGDKNKTGESDVDLLSVGVVFNF